MAASACLPLGWGRSYFLPPKGGRHGAGESTSRDGAILTEAAATALAWRTLEIVEAPPLEAANAEVHIRRVEEFKALFALVKRIDASSLRPALCRDVRPARAAEEVAGTAG